MKLYTVRQKLIEIGLILIIIGLIWALIDTRQKVRNLLRGNDLAGKLLSMIDFSDGEIQ